MNPVSRSKFRRAAIVASAVIGAGVGAQSAMATVLNSDGDFGIQTIGSTVGSPWTPTSNSHQVTAASQSPFQNIYADNGRGSEVGPDGGNPYYVINFSPIAANRTAPLYFNVDFLNTTSAETGDYSLTIGANADGSKLTAGLFVAGNAVYAQSGSGIGSSVLSPEQGVWYNAQLTLDMASNTYSGVITRAGSFTQTPVSGRSFITENVINHLYTDGGTSAVGGAAPGHYLDNWALSTSPIRTADQVRVAPTNFVNVDFNGRRDNDALGTTYSGAGRGGGGNVFNGVTADSNPAGGGNNDLLTVTPQSALLDSNGVSTGISFSISPVGGDNNGAPSNPDSPTSSNALFGDYVFNNSAGNGQPGNTTTSALTITGLPAGSYVDLYFYRVAGVVSLDDSLGIVVPNQGIYTTGNTLKFQDVLVSDQGTINATLPAGVTNVLNGFSVGYTAVPEPGSFAVIGAGALGFLTRRRRNG